MCGIFGIIANQESGVTPEQFKQTLYKLYRRSQSRGQDASGIAFLFGKNIKVYKQPIPGSKLVKQADFRNLLDEAINKSFKADELMSPLVALGHVRLATNGPEEANINNQPVIKDSIVGAHNGIIVNVDELWQKNPDLKRKYEVDTEVLLSLIRKNMNQGLNIVPAIKQGFAQIYGYASTAFLFSDLNAVVLATNNGSLYSSVHNGMLTFASEKYILKSVLKENDGNRIKQILPNKGKIISLGNYNVNDIVLDSTSSNQIAVEKAQFNITDCTKYQSFQSPRPDPELAITHKQIEDHYVKIQEQINNLGRCTRCILSETMPFIEFDENGVCNYCRNYKKMQHKGEEALEKKLSIYRKDNKVDNIVMFSGGRDSSYSLHLLKTKYQMNPIAYSYDWGMITDLARRNQSRLCGKLGIEHILVSANIRAKRKNIKKNVLAWLKKPDLGTVPLFMAGDKQYFYYANQLGKHTNIQLLILGINLLEKTDFKWGFCGIPPQPETHYKLSLENKIKQASYYGKNFISNPRYLNTSLLDSLWAYLSFYFIKHEYLNIYEYIKWDEEMVNDVLLNEYSWETAEDTKSTWRIGDGTAPFYNYIYYTIAGFTENDTFRSNQIREGMITREKALQIVERDNAPRIESIKWYCDTVGVDFKYAIKKINHVKKLFTPNP